MVETLYFKSTDAAFTYAKEYFSKSKLSLNASFIGIVKFIDTSKEPEVYMVEIICKAGNFLKRKTTVIAAALRHPDLSLEIEQNDLIVFGPDNIELEIPSGYLLYKLQPEFDTKTNQFKICDATKKFIVYVDDHFHYQNKDERYQYGEFDTIEDAIAACKMIVDRSLNHLLESCSIEELKESYYLFGEDPFIEGQDFSSSQYVDEKIQSLSKMNDQKRIEISYWETDINYRYGLLLPESEIIESDEVIYFCQTNRNKLVAGWKKDNKTFDVNIDRSLLDGLSFSTPKRFEQIVFGETDGQLNLANKQYLIEYLLFGLGTGDYKTLTKKTDNGSRIEFSIDSKAWNEMLIGKAVGIEGVCKYFEKTATEERILNFALMCDNWNVTIEYVLGEYDDYEQHEFMLKQFDNYYSN